MSEKIILSLSNVNKIVPPAGKHILKNISLSFFYGAKIGVIGINGSGKSTLLKILSGLEKEFDGDLVIDKKMSLGFLPQEPILNQDLNVIENIKEGMKETMSLLKEFDDLSEKMGQELNDNEMNKVMERFAEVQEKIEQVNGWEIERTLEIAMKALKVPPAQSNIKTLSGGEKRRVSLCKLLIEAPDILILDEPTNHLDAESVAWLENYLKSFPGTVITVTHDRYFLDNVTEWILELDRGEAFPFKGNYNEWLKQKLNRIKQEEKSESKRQKTVKRELEWIQKNTKGRQAKSKARITTFEHLLEQSGKDKIDKTEINIPIPQRLGEKVINLSNISKQFNDKILIKDFNMLVNRGAIIGIIGANGMGKTTLFNIITKKEQQDQGTIEIGETVSLAYVDQFRDDLANNNNIWEVISDGQEEIDLGFRKIHSRAYVSSFGFKGQDQQKKVGKLSGGERNRVHLAKLLKSGGNVLLLDEPTNDLDIETLRALEDALLEFCGCILVISHDRFFLDRICTHIISFEGNGKLVYYNGNFSEYEEFKLNKLGEDKTKKKTTKHKKIRN